MEEQNAVAPTEEQQVAEVPGDVVSEPTENEEAQSSEEHGDDAPPKGKDAESRIKELNWKKKNAEEQAQYWRDMYERREMMQRQQEAPRPEEPQLDIPAAPVPPDRFDFDSDQEYQQAVSKYQQDHVKWFNSAIETREKAALAKQQQTQRQAVFNERQQSLAQKVEAGRQKYVDFDSVVFNQSVPFSDAMTEAIIDAGNSADIAYHLGSNPQEAARIASLSPMQQIMEVAKLDVTIQGKQKKQTKAPPPSEPVQGGDTMVSRDPDKMSIEEWRKWRKSGKN